MATEESRLLKCDICGEPEGYLIPQSEEFGSGGVYVCKNCGFVHVKERRSQDEVAAAWDDIYGDGYTSAWPAVQARLEYVAEWAGPWTDRTVLEIGAGEGSFLERVSSRGGIPFGVEPFIENIQTLKAKGIRCHHGTSENFVDANMDNNKRFDTVCLLWTLENCSDCISLLEDAAEMTKQDGEIVIATGSRILVPFKKPIRSYFSNNPPDTHCFRWTESSLRNALIKVGFGDVVFNPYDECDWMVCIARRGAGQMSYDNPHQVLAYFDAWGDLPA